MERVGLEPLPSLKDVLATYFANRPAVAARKP